MDELSISPSENSTEGKENALVIPQITFNVADDDEEYLHEDELDGGVWKGPPGSLTHNIDDELDPEVLEHLHSPDKYDINGINIPLAKPQPEQHVY